MHTKTYSNISNAKRAIKGMPEGTYTVTGCTVTFLAETQAAKVEKPVSATTKAIVKAATLPTKKERKAATNAAIAKAPKAAKGMSRGKFFKETKRAAKEIATDKRSEAASQLPEGFKPQVDIHTSTKAAAKMVKRAGKAEAGYQIEKGRAEAHGLRRPSSTTIAGNLWAMFDTLAAQVGGVTGMTAKLARDGADKVAINKNQAVIEFYRWRKFNGVRGRVNLKKAHTAQAKAVKPAKEITLKIV